MNTMKWLLKREYWEHKGGFFWAPVVVSGLLALLTIGSMLFASVAGSKGGFRLDGNNSAINLQQALNNICVSAEDRVRPRPGGRLPCRRHATDVHLGLRGVLLLPGQPV